ncbi:hypothetical protein FORC60_3425 [Bacillus cereus]|nr:hypothetical protein FORC60_3425 [Bacillus cereus]
MWIFPSTPTYQITILLLLPFIILTLSGLRALTSYSMLVFFFTTWMPLFLLFSLKTNYTLYTYYLFLKMDYTLL